MVVILIEYNLQPPEGWEGGIGYVTKEMIQTVCPSPAPDIQVKLKPVFLNLSLSLSLSLSLITQ